MTSMAAIDQVRTKLKSLPPIKREKTPEEAIEELKDVLIEVLKDKGYQDDIDGLIDKLNEFGIKGGKTRLKQAVRKLLPPSK